MTSSSSRRRFLTHASAAGLVTGIAGITQAQLGVGVSSPGIPSGAPNPQPLDLGMHPLAGSHELVVHPKENVVLATFAATQGSSIGIGVLEMHGCADWNLSDSESNMSSVITDELPICSIHEIHNSDWAQNSGLRHFVVTLLGEPNEIGHRGKNLECLAMHLHGEFFPPCPYGDVLDYIDSVDAMTGSNQGSGGPSLP